MLAKRDRVGGGRDTRHGSGEETAAKSAGAAAVALGGEREAPEHRSRERVFDRLTLERIAAARSEVQVGLHHQHPRPDALEADDAAAAFLAAVETDVVRAQARRQAGREEKVT